MDLSKPRYLLEEVKRLIAEGHYAITLTALQSAHSLGFSKTLVADVVLGLNKGDFDKTTTDNRNHKVWQDVYRKTVNGLNLYIKLKITSTDDKQVLVLSFKRDENVRVAS
jgi:motility quorum-sensing regulator / GCU-specific mRNA interferase toxin